MLSDREMVERGPINRGLGERSLVVQRFESTSRRSQGGSRGGLAGRARDLAAKDRGREGSGGHKLDGTYVGVAGESIFLSRAVHLVELVFRSSDIAPFAGTFKSHRRRSFAIPLTLSAIAARSH